MQTPRIFVRPSHTEIRTVGRGLEDDHVEIIRPDKIIVEVFTGPAGRDLTRITHIVDIEDLVEAWVNQRYREKA